MDETDWQEGKEWKQREKSSCLRWKLLDDGLSVFSAGSFHQGLQQFAPWHDPIVSDWLATTIISYSIPVLLSYTAIAISMLQAIGIVQHIVSMSHQSSVQKIRSIENVFAQRSKLDCKSSQHTVSQRYILSQSNTAMLTSLASSWVMAMLLLVMSAKAWLETWLPILRRWR